MRYLIETKEEEEKEIRVFVTCEGNIINLLLEKSSSVENGSDIPFTYSTLFWIQQKLEGKTRWPPENPLEILRACSHLRLKDLAWEVYIQRVMPYTKLLASLNEKQTFIPASHIRNRLKNADYWDLDVINYEDMWSHYEEKDKESIEFIFQRKVASNFSKIERALFYERGKLIDTRNMKMREELPLSGENVYFLQSVQYTKLLYFIVQEAVDRICVYSWNRWKDDPPALFLKHTSSNILNRCEFMYVYGGNSVVLAEWEEGCLQFTQIYNDGRDTEYFRGSEISGKKISNAIRPFGGTFLVESKGKYILKQEFFRNYIIEDSSSIEAVYVTELEVIGVYEGEGGYFDFYKLKPRDLMYLEKGDFIRRIEKFSFANVKTIYSADSRTPWMILRRQ